MHMQCLLLSVSYSLDVRLALRLTPWPLISSAQISITGVDMWDNLWSLGQTD